jgi:hypothetical protein
LTASKRRADLAGRDIEVSGLFHLAGGPVPDNIQKKTGALTELKEYPDRSHYTFSQDGWEEVADYSLDWAVRNART